MKFHETLLQIRKTQGLSQEALAEKVGVSRQAVSKWETGEALPDLQKAVALSDALGVPLDALCGKPVPAAQEAAPAAGKKSLRSLWLSLLFLCVGLVLGRFALQSPAEAPQVTAMPDLFTVSSISFESWGSGNDLTWQFVPSAAGSGYTYRISFTDLEGNTLGFDAAYSDGMCAGRVQLSPLMEYTVTATVKSGEEERAVPLAKALRIYENQVSWEPVTP